MDSTPHAARRHQSNDDIDDDALMDHTSAPRTILSPSVAVRVNEDLVRAIRLLLACYCEPLMMNKYSVI